MADNDDVTAELTAAPPGLLSRGAYSLYKTPDDGLHLVYRPDGDGEDKHIPIPARLLKLAGMAAGGRGPLAMLRALVPGGGGE